MTVKKRLLVRDNVEFGSREHYLASVTKKKGLTYPEYLNKIAQKLGFKNATEYTKYIWQKHGFKTQEEYLTFLAKKGGLETPGQYQKKLMVERSHSKRYRVFARNLNLRMIEMHMTVAELAKKTGINGQDIYAYLKGYFYPKKQRLQKIMEVLGGSLLKSDEPYDDDF